MTELKGIPIVSGVGIGKAYFSGRTTRVTSKRTISKDEVGSQIILFNEIRDQAKRFYEHYIQRMTDIDPALQDASILNLYKQFLDDPAFAGEIVELISKQCMDLETAIRMVSQDFITRFESAKTAYVRERSGDIVEVCEKLISLLAQGPKPVLPDQSIILIVPGVLTPSDFLKFGKSAVTGIVALDAGPTSHAAILARSYGIPVVSGISNLGDRIRTDDELLVDGYNGIVYKNPEDTIRRSFRVKDSVHRRAKTLAAKYSTPVCTKDGVPISVLANIALPEDVSLAREYGADGIGLVRSEFLYLMSDRLPTEIEQQRYFEDIFEKAKGVELVIRLLDIGADKRPAQFELPKEINPFAGWRGIRILLKRKDFFVEHLSAIMNASQGRPYSIMVPMVTTLNEWKNARMIIDETAQQLNTPSPQCGILFEVPLALLEADNFIPYVDFMSLGTNDLIQYLSAADRNNSNVAYLYNPIEPAFLRIIKVVISKAQKSGKPISICGEMGGVPYYTILLLGLGLKRFSVTPKNIPLIKEIITHVSFKDASERVKDILIHRTLEEMADRVVLLNKNALGKTYDELQLFFDLF